MGCLPRRGVFHPWLISFLLYTRGGTERYLGRKERRGNIEMTLMSYLTLQFNSISKLLIKYKYGKILCEELQE